MTIQICGYITRPQTWWHRCLRHCLLF